jgi:AcrR family transcriptional regulator
MATITFKLSDKLYLKDPNASILGQRIIKEGIWLMDKIGFEDFTFKKLAEEIGSTEASIYRYFENKHRFLVYLIDWYWIWLEYRIDYSLSNIPDPKQKLRRCLLLLTEENMVDKNIDHVDESALQRIVVAEFEKTYLTRYVDEDNKDGVFLPFKLLCKKIAGIISEINPTYTFPHTLVSTVMLSITHQLYYAQHLPSLTDIQYDKKNQRKQLFDFIIDLTQKVISE